MRLAIGTLVASILLTYRSKRVGIWNSFS